MAAPAIINGNSPSHTDTLSEKKGIDTDKDSVPVQDAEVDAILAEARSVHAASTSLHNHRDVLKIVQICDLSAFIRAGTLQQLYETRFLPTLKAKYGDVAQYLMKRLGWTEHDVVQARATKEHFTRDIDERWIRIGHNDWQYSIPPEYEHMLVWSLLPFLHWPSAPEFVQNRGVSGRVVGKDNTKKFQIDAEGNKDVPACEEIIAFARKRWPDATELIWFVNPVKLQSVPGLAHAHVLVRRGPLDDLE